MGLKKLILNFVLNFFSILLPLFPIKRNRITFVSLTANELKDDFLLLNQELEKNQDIELRYVLIKFKKNIIGDMLYFFNCIKQLFIINTSHIVILNDNNYVVSNFKREGVIVIQVWHACGAVKKFGNDIEREYEIRNYDYVISNSDYWKPVYESAFHLPQSHVLTYGMPRVDKLFDFEWIEDRKREMKKKYPILENHYIYLYAPTFRGNIIKGFSYEKIELNDVIEKLPSNVVILYRMHPLLHDISLGENEKVINVANEELNDLLACADCLISDYSSIIFDFSILLKRMICYVPDLEEYKSTLGLNVDYEMIPAKKCFTKEELIQEMKNINENQFDMKQFKDTFFKYQDGKSVERIVEWMLKL